MPTVLFVLGWRLFFYANEGFEPMHIHARKGEAECKFWLLQDRFEIQEAFEHRLTPSLRREVRRIIYQHFDDLCAAWRERFGETHAN